MQVNQDNVYIVFGDSIVYGLYDKEYCGWVNRLRKKLENISENNYIVNLGIPGQCSLDIKKRFELEIKNRYNDYDNFILLFAFGIKDALKLNDNLNYINEFKDNVKHIISRAREYTSNIYFVGLLQPDYDTRKEYSVDYVNDIDKILCECCNSEEIKYINVSNLISKNELVDGLHPLDNGHEKIASYIFECLLNDQEK